MGNGAGRSLQDCKKSGGKALTLDNCSLTSFPKNVFKDFPNLEALSLNRNQITQIPTHISSFSNLKILKLAGNKITEIPAQISALENLIEIDLMENVLQSIPTHIGGMGELTKIIFKNNKIKEIPEEIGKLGKLINLYLDINEIVKVPPTIGLLHQLTVLNLHDNQIETLPDTISGLTALTSLDISSNRLDSVPKEIGSLVELQELYLLDNNLKSIPAEIGKLIALKNLDISENRITELPAEIGECIELTQINISDNALTVLTENIGHCDRLELLKLSNNKLKSLPTSIQELVDLQELHVENNLIESIQQELDDVIEALAVFLAEGNPFHGKKEVPTVTKEQFEDKIMVKLCGGNIFKIISRRGKIDNKLLFLDFKSMRIQSLDKKSKPDREYIDASQLADVYFGLKTRNLKKYGKPMKDDCYFSLISPQVTIDLEANTPDERNDWGNTFKQFIQYCSENPSVFEHVPLSSQLSSDNLPRKSKKQEGNEETDSSMEGSGDDLPSLEESPVSSPGSDSDKKRKRKSLFPGKIAAKKRSSHDKGKQEVPEGTPPETPRSAAQRLNSSLTTSAPDLTKKFDLTEEKKENSSEKELSEDKSSDKSDSSSKKKIPRRSKLTPNSSVTNEGTSTETAGNKELTPEEIQENRKSIVLSRKEAFEKKEEETKSPKPVSKIRKREITRSLSAIATDDSSPKSTYTGQTVRGNVLEKLKLFEKKEDGTPSSPAPPVKQPTISKSVGDNSSPAASHKPAAAAEPEQNEIASRAIDLVPPAEKEIELKARKEAEEKVEKEEAEKKAKSDAAELKAKKDAEEKAAASEKAEKERKEKEAAEEKARKEKEGKEKEAAELKAKKEAEEKAAAEKAEKERKAKEEEARLAAELKAKKEAEEKAAAEKAEKERKEKEAAELKAKKEAEEKAAAEKAAAEKAERERKEKEEREAAERAAAEKAEKERKAKEEEEARIAAELKAKKEAEEKAERERKEKEAAELKAKREAEEKAERERIEKLNEEERKRAEEKLEREIQERKEREAAEKARQEAEEKARKEKEEREAAELKAKKEAEEKAEKERKEAAELKAKKEAEEKARKEKEEREAAELKAKKEAEEKAAAEKAEKERKEKEAAELKAKQEAEEKARKEKEEKEAADKAAAELKAKKEAEEKAASEKAAAEKAESELKAKKEVEEKERKEKEAAAEESKEAASREEGGKEEIVEEKKEGGEKEEEGAEEVGGGGNNEKGEGSVGTGAGGDGKRLSIAKKAGGVKGRRLPTRKAGGTKLATDAQTRLKEAEDRRANQLEEINRRREENMKKLLEEEEKLANLSPEERAELEEKEKNEQKAREEEETLARIQREEKEREEAARKELERQKQEAIKGALGALKSVENKREEPKNRLVLLKGKRRVRANLVETSPNSLNEGDVFILDCKLLKKIFIWIGKKSNRMETAKATELTQRLKNQERKTSEIVKISQGEETEEFWKEIGGKGEIKSAEQGGNDIDYERECDNNFTFIRVIKNEENEFDIEFIELKKLLRENLMTDQCYILDTVSEVHVWVGKSSSQTMRTFTMNHAKDKILSNRPPHCYFARNIEGGEEILFKEKFANWPDHVMGMGMGPRPAAQPAQPKQSIRESGAGGKLSESSSGKGLIRNRSMLMGRIKKELKIDVNKLHTATRPEQELLGDGITGSIEAWVVLNGKLEKETDLLEGHFFSGESYIILYTFTKGNSIRYHIYIWQGLDTSKQDSGMASLLVRDIQSMVRKEKGAEPFSERVVPFKEPDQFLVIFKGKFIIHQGRKRDLLAETSSKSKSGPTFYRIQSKSSQIHTRATELPLDGALLNSKDIFIINTPKKQYQWVGSGANDLQKQTAMEIGTQLGRQRVVKSVPEGSEDKKFWKLLGGSKKVYANINYLKKKDWSPKFFICSGIGSDFKVEPVFECAHSDLDPAFAVIVDVIAEVFVWTGARINEETQKQAMETATEYVRAASDGRLQNTPIYFVPQGQESNTFISQFPYWRDFQERGDDKKLELVTEVLKDYERVYTWEELTAKHKPKGLDMKHLESYLANDVFQSKFGMGKEEWWKLPNWKRTEIKKKVHFF